MIDADSVATAVRALMTARTKWTGIASDLLGALVAEAGERVAKSKTWPDSPRALSGRLRRAATILRKIGIEISFEREGRARTRTIEITTTLSEPEKVGAQPSAPSASSGKPKAYNALPSTPPRTVARTGINAVDDADDADANPPIQSALETGGAEHWETRL